MPSSLGARPRSRQALEARRGFRRLAPCLLILALAGQAAPAAAQKVRVTGLSDVNFGLIADLQADSRQAQNICVYSQSSGERYSITATGSGPGSSFALTNGSNLLAYDVEWSDQSGQSSGTSLAPSVAATGRVSPATHQTCNNGPATSASLIIILRSAALSQAREGSYSGSLTLLVAAE